MIMSNTSRTMMHVSAIMLSLVLFPSCGVMDKTKQAEEKKEATQKVDSGKTEGATLLTIDGKVAIDEGIFNRNLNQMLQSSPYFRGATADALPSQIKRRFFDELIKQELIVSDADSKQVEKDAEFRKAYAEMKDLLKRSLKIQMFEKGIFENIKVSDSDIKKHFEESKEHYVKVAGGVLAVGVKFDKEDQAQAFLNSVKNKADDFEKLGKDSKAGKFKDFGRVGKENKGFGAETVPAPIKEAVLAAKDMPFIGLVKSGKEFWVVKASDKKDAVYFELDEIKQQLEGMIKNNKFKEVLDEKIKTLKENHKIDVNEDFFKEKQAPALDNAQDKKIDEKDLDDADDADEKEEVSKASAEA